MKRNYTLVHLLIVAVFASIISIAIILAYEQIFNVSPVFALQPEEGIQEIILYAGPREDTVIDESFIFYNKRTGDLWVYRNAKFRVHYRVRNMGQDLEKVKD